MLEVEVFGAAGELPPLAEITRLCNLAAASAGVDSGHLAIEFVDAAQIARLNERYRGKPTATDVLAFPVDGAAPVPARELGDVVICPEHAVDVRETIVHGVLHLLGMDHETDDGQMLARQRELLTRSQKWSSG